ncbi:MAG: extracellular solute-binding protein [Acetobacteraceae bacterium]
MHKFRVAVRKFGPLENAIVKQWQCFIASRDGAPEIEAVAFDLDPLHEALFDRREAASGGWDVAFLPTDWIAAAQAGGLVADLRPLMAQRPIPGFPEAWSPSLLRLQDFAGGFWGMPYHDGPQCLIYRTDLLGDIPRTWDSFYASARRLNDPASGLSGTVLALYPDGHNGFYDFCVQLWTRGGAPFDDSGRPQLQSAEAVSALDFIRGLAADRSATPPDGRTIDSVASGIRFAEGRVALMANWFGFATYAATAPESQVKGRVGIAPLPRGAGGPSVSLNVYWMLCICAGSQQRDLAWEFLRHCATPAMDMLTTTEGAVGVRRSTWTDAELNRSVPFYHELDGLHEVARTLPRLPRLSDVARAIDGMLAEALTTDVPTPEVLARAQARVAAIVA